MERSREFEDVAVALAEVRPTPRADFAAELDELLAAGFPQRSRFGRPPLPALATRLRGLSPQRLLFTTGGTALAAIAIATVVVASVDSGPGPTAGNRLAAEPEVQSSEQTPRLSGGPKEPSAAAGSGSSSGASGSSSGVEYSSPLPQATSDAELQNASPSELPNRNATAGLAGLGRTTHRDIERSAEISLLAERADIADDSAKVFSAVHDVDGIVLHSTTTTGRNARAEFDLLIPSAKLGDALAAFSAIDEVRTRHEATDDITAPRVALGELLQDSRAKIDSLLSQLSAAETESAMEALEIELRGERRHAAGLRSRLDRLHQRADFSRVSLRIETGASAAGSSGHWGIDDALDNAGHILGIAAGVTVIAFAVITPLVLIGLLAWLAHRVWLRGRRERALDT
jgi:hypothetical protein